MHVGIFISHLKSVLHSIIDAILFLAKQGKSFRGTHETKDFGAPDSGSYFEVQCASLSTY